MIKKILNFLSEINDRKITVGSTINYQNKYHNLDKVINEFKLKEQSRVSEEQKEQNFRNETLSYIMKDSQKIFQNNINQFNLFLGKYGLKFLEPRFYKYSVTDKVESIISSDCIGIKSYIKVQFDIRDKEIYEDFKNDKLKIKYHLVDDESAKIIISSYNFDEVVSGFVDYNIKILANR